MVKEYRPNDVVVTWNGIPITGFADGTFINAERDNPSWTSGTGSDGEGFRAKSSDQSGTVTITLLQTSAANDLLAAAAAVDELAGANVGSLLIKDNSGRTILTAQTAWIEQPASVEFAREVTNREWVIKTDTLVMGVAGN